MDPKQIHDALVAKGWASAEEKESFRSIEGVDAALVKAVDALPESDDAATAEVEKTVASLLEKSVKQMREGMEKEFGAKFEAWKKDQKTVADKRAGLYNPDVKAKRAELNANVRKFVVALKQNDHAVMKALSTGTDAAGGYLLDSQIEQEVVVIAQQYGKARQEMFVTTLEGNSLKVNRLATDVNVYWTDEGAPKTTSDAAFGQVELAVKKLAVIVIMTDELLQDAGFDVLGFLEDRIGQAMARKEDEAFANGDGSPEFGGFTGFLNAEGVNEVLIGDIADITVDDLIGMQDATPTSALANAKYHLHRSVLSAVRKLKDTTGAYLFVGPQSGAPATLAGYPVVVWEAMPNIADEDATGFVAFGDLRQACWIATKGGVSVAVSNEATVRNAEGNADVDLFRNDMTALRVVERVGYLTVNPSLITVLKVGEAEPEA